jgi:hypothetical protein
VWKPAADGSFLPNPDLQARNVTVNAHYPRLSLKTFAKHAKSKNRGTLTKGGVMQLAHHSRLRIA